MIQVEYVRQERVEGEVEVEFEPAKQGIGYLLSTAVDVLKGEDHPELVAVIKNDFGQTEHIPAGDITIQPTKAALSGCKPLNTYDMRTHDSRPTLIQDKGSCLYSKCGSEVTGDKSNQKLTRRQDRAVNCFLSHGRSTIKNQPQFIQDLYCEGEKIIESMQ